MNQVGMGYPGKDIKGVLLNEPTVFQNWGLDVLTGFFGVIDSKWAILILFTRTICHRMEPILRVPGRVGL